MLRRAAEAQRAEECSSHLLPSRKSQWGSQTHPFSAPSSTSRPASLSPCFAHARLASMPSYARSPRPLCASTACSPLYPAAGGSLKTRWARASLGLWLRWSSGSQENPASARARHGGCEGSFRWPPQWCVPHSRQCPQLPNNPAGTPASIDLHVLAVIQGRRALRQSYKGDRSRWRA
jgi:hypothetical protein